MVDAVIVILSNQNVFSLENVTEEKTFLALVMQGVSDAVARLMFWHKCKRNKL